MNKLSGLYKRKKNCFVCIFGWNLFPILLCMVFSKLNQIEVDQVSSSSEIFTVFCDKNSLRDGRGHQTLRCEHSYHNIQLRFYIMLLLSNCLNGHRCGIGQRPISCSLMKGKIDEYELLMSRNELVVHIREVPPNLVLCFQKGIKNSGESF